MFITALFTIATIKKQHKYPSVGEWIMKVSHTHTHARAHTHTHTHTHTGIFLSHKKE